MWHGRKAKWLRQLLISCSSACGPGASITCSPTPATASTASSPPGAGRRTSRSSSRRGTRRWRPSRPSATQNSPAGSGCAWRPPAPARSTCRHPQGPHPAAAAQGRPQLAGGHRSWRRPLVGDDGDGGRRRSRPSQPDAAVPRAFHPAAARRDRDRRLRLIGELVRPAAEVPRRHAGGWPQPAASRAFLEPGESRPPYSHRRRAASKSRRRATGVSPSRLPPTYVL
jgi:hypothetical protein